MSDSRAQESGNTLVLSFLSVRKWIGFIAFFLPIVLFSSDVVLPMFGVQVTHHSSISDYYHGPMRDFLVGSLLAIAVFLATYNGYEKEDNEKYSAFTDRRMSILAAASAALVALVPAINESTKCIETSPVPNDTFLWQFLFPVLGCETSSIHFLAAATLLASLAFISYVNFCRTSSADPDHGRRNRKRVYRSSAIVIVVCMVLCVMYFAYGELTDRNGAVSKNKIIFWLEAIAVWSFAVAWLVKGEAYEMLPNAGKIPVIKKLR